MATFTPLDITLLPVAVVRILGIDPGTQVVGYGCLELAAGSLPGSGRAASAPLAMRGSNVVRASAIGGGGARVVSAGVFRLGKRGDALPSRLLSLSEQFAALLAELRPTEVAVEEAFFGKSVQSALRIGEARGVVLAEAARAELTIHQYAPARIKRCVTGNGSARKESVAKMLAQIVDGLSAPAGQRLPADATDAVAVAWTRLEELRSPLAAAADRPRRGRATGG